jgi:hypothetical protein
LIIALWTPLYVLFGRALPLHIREKCIDEMRHTGALIAEDDVEEPSG